MAMFTQDNQSDSDASRWRQVLARDARADGTFFYAVTSTGIVCRPSCPSRRPSRSNVEFFLTLKEALRAGYRTCQRCGPDSRSVGPDPHAGLVERVALRLRNDAEQHSATEIARAEGVDRLLLMRAFRRVFGVSPAQYARAQRMEQFKKKMRRSPMNVTDAIYEAGFGSSSRLYENSSARLGMTPRQLRNGATGIRITYATASTALGRMLVAATARGVCSIGFGLDDRSLITDLRSQFPHATLEQQDATDGWLAEAIQYIASQTTEHPQAATFPLDVRATAFQQRVWSALQQIPRGETRSYSRLAEEIGSPAATRAVARACATNPVAVLVPCHRVIGKDGTLTGYRWGSERKQQLLAAEKLTPKTPKRLQ